MTLDFYLTGGEIAGLYVEPEKKSISSGHAGVSRKYTIPQTSHIITLTDGDTHHSLWGNLLWNSSIEAAKHVQNLKSLPSLTVLELGAGLGLPSIVAAKLGAKKVVVTDYPDHELLSNLRANVNRNLAQNAQGQIFVQGLLWGNSAQISKVRKEVSESRFDIIIISDLIFNHVCHHDLALSIMELLKIDGKCICTYAHHVPRRMQNDMDFFKVIEKYHLYAYEPSVIDFTLATEEDREREQTSLVYSREIIFKYPTSTYHKYPQKQEKLNYQVVIYGSSILHSLVGLLLSKAKIKTLLLEEDEEYGDIDSTLSIQSMYIRCLQSGGTFEFLKEAQTVLSQELQIESCPKIMLSHGSLFNFLHEHSVGDYVEFDSVRSLSILTSDGLQEVPLDKASIFSADSLSLHEKRISMRFIQSIQQCLDDADMTLQEREDLAKEICKQYSSSALIHRMKTVFINEDIDSKGDEDFLIDSMFACKKSSQAGYKTPYFSPIYGQKDIVEGVLRAACLRGMTCIKGHCIPQNIGNASFDTSDKIETQVTLAGQRKIDSGDMFYFVICSTEPYIPAQSKNADELPIHLSIILPHGTPYNTERVRLFIKKDERSRYWVSYFISKESLSALQKTSTFCMEKYWNQDKILFTCSWTSNREALVDDHPTSENSHIIFSEHVSSFDQPEKLLEQAKVIAKDVLDRLRKP